MPITNSGRDASTSEVVDTMWSIGRSRHIAVPTPMISDSGIANAAETTTRNSELPTRSDSSCPTGAWVAAELPRSPVRMPPSHLKYCETTGSSRWSWSRSAWRRSGVASRPRMAWAASPGRASVAAKMSSDTSQSVSTPRASRRRTSRTDTPPRSHISEGRASRPRAVLFDFNGTLSDDEPVLFGIYAELCSEEGRPLTERDYYDRLAGLSDRAIFAGWLGADHPGIDRLVAERVARYRARVADGSTVGEAVRAAVRYA